MRRIVVETAITMANAIPEFLSGERLLAVNEVYLYPMSATGRPSHGGVVIEHARAWEDPETATSMLAVVIWLAGSPADLMLSPEAVLLLA
jgi:hypothetical protein